MKCIHYHKYSLFRLEKVYHKGLKYVGEFGSTIMESCFEYIDTFDTLELAQLAQKEFKQKTIILTSW